MSSVADVYMVQAAFGKPDPLAVVQAIVDLYDALLLQQLDRPSDLIRGHETRPDHFLDR